jgi:hypothetical protein
VRILWLDVLFRLHHCFVGFCICHVIGTISYMIIYIVFMSTLYELKLNKIDSISILNVIPRNCKGKVPSKNSLTLLICIKPSRNNHLSRRHLHLCPAFCLEH